MRISQSTRAGVIFPVAKFHMKLRRLPQRVKRVSKTAAVYTTAVLEYLTAEIIELSGNISIQDRKKRISPRHIKLAILGDAELEKLLKDIIIPQSGVLPTPTMILRSNPKKVTTQKSYVKPSVKIANANSFTLPNQVAKKSIKSSQKSTTGVTTLSQRILNKGQTLTVIEGDITNVKVDAIVSHFYLSGQVGAAISRKGGPELQTIINNHRQNSNKMLSVCEVDISNASKNLLCDKIMHVNSPSWDQSLQTQKINELSRTVENILCLAEENKLKSIALPSISSGGNMYPKQVAAQTILRAITKHFKLLEKNDSLPKSSIENVFFVLFDRESVNVYTSELGKLDLQ